MTGSLHDDICSTGTVETELDFKNCNNFFLLALRSLLKTTEDENVKKNVEGALWILKDEANTMKTSGQNERCFRCSPISSY